MIELLHAYFDKNIPVTGEQFNLVSSFFEYKKLTKGSFLLREGEIANKGALVGRGCLRSYAIDNNGREHILQFAPEHWWLSNLHSILKKTPSTYFIDALEDSDVFLLDEASFRDVCRLVPEFAASFQTGIQHHAAAKDRRIIANLST